MTLTRREVIVGAAVAALATSLPAMAAVEPASKVFFIPSISFIERHADSVMVEENTKTIIHEVMERWETHDGKLVSISRAPVDSDMYREWLKETPPKNGIPPHIQFGGAVVAGKGDPTFHPRWVERTKAHLASGRLK